MADNTPTVPGYEIGRLLGRGGMASVYLATQQSVDREVALKIMAPQLSADPSFGDRFLREARIAAKLHHRHVVSIYDVGVHDGVHYCAMEYLPGGPVMRRGAPPLAAKPAVRCVREIAMALHYAHEKGFIHRDVKPDNILLREDGSHVLSDFGIARAADSGTIMTKTGAVVGTPHYMSPEQLRGRAIDGRADLYSLGVVFFQLLTGRVPYEASDSLAIGIMHMTAPLPQLSREYQAFQPVLDLMLAKEPGDRFQTGAEIDQALDKIQRQLEAGELATPLPPSRKAPSLRAERRAFEQTGNIRTEPQIGRLDDVDREPMRATPRPSVSSPAPKRGSAGRWIVLALLLAAVGAGYQFRDRWLPMAMAYLEPAPDEVALGEAAMAEGRLLGTPGQDAVSLFVAALMLDRDNARARQGLNDALDRLYRELSASRDGDRIEDLLRRLRGVPDGAALAERFAALQTQNTPPPEPPKPPPPKEVPGAAEYAAAQRAEIAGRFGGGDGALALYLAAAKAGRNEAEADAARIAQRLGDDAERAIERRDIDTAMRLLDDLTRHSPSAGRIAALSAALDSTRRAVENEARIPALLAEARALANRERLVEPAGAAAADRYLDVLKLDADNGDAKVGLESALAGALLQVQKAIDARQLDRAQKIARRVQQLAPRTAGLADAKVRIDIAVEAAKGPTPEQRAQHDKLIREGDVALSTGQLLDPPGDSAYDKYRSALAIDRNSESAKAGMEEVAKALKVRIDESIAEGRPTRAHGDLEALLTVASRDRDVELIKRRVAKAYADLGLKQLQNNRIESARESLLQAQRLDPAGTEVAALRAQLGM